MTAPQVLVVGAGGYFGRLLVSALLEQTGCAVVAAGRSPRRLESLYAQAPPGRLSVREADLLRRDSVERAVSGVDAAICAAGPYQRLPMTLLDVCLERGLPYLDLADDRAFVMRARAAAGPSPASSVCVGWSTVPALSAALTAAAATGLKRLRSIRVQMAPGNRGPRRAATIASLLASAGRPLKLWRGSQWRSVRGWSEPRLFPFPAPVGPRQGWLVDAPDHELFPSLFGADTVEFRAGAEIPALNVLMSALARVPVDWTSWAPAFSSALGLLGGIGSDAGAVGVELEGEDRDGPLTRRLCVVADRQAARIAVLPAVMAVDRLVSKSLGAGLVPLHSWADEKTLLSWCDRFGFRLAGEEIRG